MFQVNNGKTKTICEICSKLIIKTSLTSFCLFIVQFKQISHIVLVFPFLTLNKLMPPVGHINDNTCAEVPLFLKLQAAGIEQLFHRAPQGDCFLKKVFSIKLFEYNSLFHPAIFICMNCIHLMQTWIFHTVCTPLPFGWAGGEGGAVFKPPTKFSKRGGLDRTSTLRGDC